MWGVDPALKGKTWGKAVLAWVRVEERSESELLSLAKFARCFKDRPLDAITPEAVDEALGFCKTVGTYMRYRAMVAAILTMAHITVKLLSRRDKKPKTRLWLTPDQWDALHAELPPHMLPMAEFAIASGLRQANVLRLTWSKIDLERKLVWVEAEDAKAGKAITVPLSDQALAVLTAQIGQHPEYPFTFRGKPIEAVKTAFHAACIRAGVGQRDEAGVYSGFTWHGFRHTWATWHVQNGTPIEVLQKLGGWADLRMVMKYVHHTPGYLAGFANNSRGIK